MGKNLKIVFMGTAEFAVPSLEFLIQSGHAPLLTVTQPDRPAGRGRQLQPSPVKEVALSNQLALAQPQSPKKEAQFQQQLIDLKPDLLIVAAYGCLLPEAILRIPRIAAVNLHGSLLPAYRGAAPIQWSIIDGQKQTGVTLMEMVLALDAGNIIDSLKTTIGEQETYGELQQRLAKMGPQLLEKYLHAVAAGKTVASQPQDAQKVTLAPLITPQVAMIDWQKDATAIHNLIRGLNPKPLAMTGFAGQRLKVLASAVLSTDAEHAAEVSPGSIVRIGKENIDIICGHGILSLLRVIPANRGAMTAADFARGSKAKEGDCFVSLVAS